MTDTETIYTPLDDSLEERVKAYRSVREAWLNAEASLKYAEDGQGDWNYTLGDREEIEQAHEISARSLSMATEDISQDEIKQAISNGLLEVEEAKEFEQHRRQRLMQNTRSDQDELSDSSDDSHQQ